MSVVPGMTMVVLCPASLSRFVCRTRAGRLRLPGSCLCVWGSKSISHISPRLTFGKTVPDRSMHLLVDFEVPGRKRARQERNALGERALVLLLDGLADIIRTRHAGVSRQLVGLGRELRG